MLNGSRTAMLSVASKLRLFEASLSFLYFISLRRRFSYCAHFKLLQHLLFLHARHDDGFPIAPERSGREGGAFGCWVCDITFEIGGL